MRKILNLKIMIICAIMMSMIVPMAYSIDITLLYEFTAGSNSNGGDPYGNLILDSGKFYGLTENGGKSNEGTIFSIDKNGSNFNILKLFGSNNGEDPYGEVVLDSGKLYGMTTSGGSSDMGVIFSIDTDGNNFAVLHNFTGGANDGKWSYGSLIVDSGKLYGMTNNGGDDDAGIIFSIEADGSNFALLHEFTGGVDDGGWPLGDLILDSGKLYGITYGGGDDDLGIIFSIDIDGSNFALLHEFTYANGDGEHPKGSLLLDSGKLYGMAERGGSYDSGVIFSLDTDGNNFAVLHNFAGGANDGGGPYDSLIIDSGKLYGMAAYGGSADEGVVFSIKTDGTGFALLHEFTGTVTGGRWPYGGDLLLDSKTLYGMTSGGGSSSDGVIFSLYLGSLPLYSKFAPNSKTTNISEGDDVTNITNVSLATDQGIIKFPDSYGINTDGEDYNSNVNIETGFISVNSSALHSSFNSSATLTFYNADCSNPTVYYSETNYVRGNVILEGQVCGAPKCTNIQCTDNTLTVDVQGFSAYATNGTESLDIDADDPKEIGELVTFTANYTNITTGFIDGANCTIYFNDGTYQMDEQVDIYNYSRTFSSAQTVNYNVTCDKTGYSLVSASDTAEIQTVVAVPEFSTITLGLGLVVVLAGLIIVRRKTN